MRPTAPLNVADIARGAERLKARDIMALRGYAYEAMIYPLYVTATPPDAAAMLADRIDAGTYGRDAWFLEGMNERRRRPGLRESFLRFDRWRR